MSEFSCLNYILNLAFNFTVQGRSVLRDRFNDGVLYNLRDRKILVSEQESVYNFPQDVFYEFKLLEIWLILKYLLVMANAVVQMFLCVTEHFLWNLDLSLFLLLVEIGIHVPFLIYVQNGRFELLQLTTGYRHHIDVQTGGPEEKREAHGCHEELPTVCYVIKKRTVVVVLLKLTIGHSHEPVRSTPYPNS